jgi:hypothetical protein
MIEVGVQKQAASRHWALSQWLPNRNFFKVQTHNYSAIEVNAWEADHSD